MGRPKLNHSEYYRTKAFRNLPVRCKWCRATKHLEVDHIDMNRQNNDLRNLRILCHKCHMKRHKIKPKNKYNKKFQPGTRKNKRK